MELISIAFEAGVVIASAVAAAIIAYLVFRKAEVALWAYVSAFAPRAMLVLVSLTGATNLAGLAWLSHVGGMFVYPMLLTAGNILLIEVSLAKRVRRESSLPLTLRQAVKIERFLGRLQDRKLLPRAVSVKESYLSGVMACFINLVFVLAFGLL